MTTPPRARRPSAGGGSTRRGRDAAPAPCARGWPPDRSSRARARAQQPLVGRVAERALGGIVEPGAHAASSAPGPCRLRSASRTSSGRRARARADEVALRAEQPARPVVEHVALPPRRASSSGTWRAPTAALNARPRARGDRQVGVARVAQPGAQDRGHVEQRLDARTRVARELDGIAPHDRSRARVREPAAEPRIGRASGDSVSPRIGDRVPARRPSASRATSTCAGSRRRTRVAASGARSSPGAGPVTWWSTRRPSCSPRAPPGPRRGRRGRSSADRRARGNAG